MAENYTTKGLYNSYDKNHKTRDQFDYYATPTEEVENILSVLNYDFSNKIILEPCAGEGHMSAGIADYLSRNNQKNVRLISTEFQERKNKFSNKVVIDFGEKNDFLADNYGIDLPEVDWIIMNPPYATIEPFTIRALEMAQEGIIMLGRLQFLEGKNRYDTILSKNPPTDVYIYVDRIQCYKGGDTSVKASSAQAYAWFIWDKRKETKETICHWIRRVN